MTAQYKHCPGCCAKGETLPASEFDIDKNQPDGMAELCKECVSYSITTVSKAKKKPKITEKTMGNYINHNDQQKIMAEPVQLPKEKTKRCGACKDEKPMSHFTSNKSNYDGKEWLCRKCKNERQVAYRTKKRMEAKKDMAVKEEAKTPYIASGRGPKDSAGKTQWSVFPFAEAEFVVRVFQKGAEKYGAPFTYRRGIPVDELIEAAMRHLIALMSGERVDPESGELHAAHVAANGLMMISQSIADGVK